MRGMEEIAKFWMRI